METESIIIEQSKYYMYDYADFKDALQQYNSKINILVLNCRSVNVINDKLMFIFLNDVSILNSISIPLTPVTSFSISYNPITDFLVICKLNDIRIHNGATLESPLCK